ncbi:hypothetical protein U1Q18_045848, partial [Sarracenia purpurea var. burkii]
MNLKGLGRRKQGTFDDVANVSQVGDSLNDISQLKHNCLHDLEAEVAIEPASHLIHSATGEVLPTLEVKALVIVTLLVDIELSLTEVVSSIGAQTGPATSSLSSSSSAHTNAPYSSFAPSAHSHATNSHASTTSITNSATHGSTTSAPGASSSPSIL